MEKHPLFQAADVLDMAVRIEDQGRAFYGKCLEKIADPQVREVLEHLMEQEGRHLELFKAMRAELNASPLPESYPGELESYVDLFVQGKVFHEDEASRRAAALQGPRDAVDFGLEHERGSIRFYSEIKGFVGESWRERIDEVVAEEKDHIRRLSALRERLPA